MGYLLVNTVVASIAQANAKAPQLWQQEKFGRFNKVQEQNTLAAEQIKRANLDRFIHRAVQISPVHFTNSDDSLLTKRFPVPSCCTHRRCSDRLPSVHASNSRRLTPNIGMLPAVESCNLYTAVPRVASRSLLCSSRARVVQASHMVPNVRSLWTPCTPPLVSGALQTSAARSVEPTDGGFEVVVFRSRKYRTRFQSMVDGFECPQSGFEWFGSFLDTFKNVGKFGTAWGIMKENMQGSKALEDMKLPVLALRDGRPCAAAFYSETRRPEITFDMISRGFTQASCKSLAFYLDEIIRTDGDDARGAGAAILCHLIRNSKDQDGEFSPLYIELLPFDVENLQRYYETFGCKQVQREMMRCYEPNPAKCAAYTDNVIDADDYFSS
eukprot:gnl/TRDRNA2_/TRDRNA2_171848_c0_seq4.p1 gnl/TRDRNA2_/TRDRNA2_171848_c0~~gnl/TRDRNA2_/TRDRNA2_171848_c0_seq4.p1  ORF type:complete len:383 (-),score=27.55 gnl/TRDRNA2_/TRDRNA2_171848_c0_seq4:152-1300(-)